MCSLSVMFDSPSHSVCSFNEWMNIKYKRHFVTGARTSAVESSLIPNEF
jgi:hypothetical protein